MHAQLRRLIFENSWLDKIDIYLIDQNNNKKKVTLGDSFAFAERTIEHRFFVFDYNYPPGISQLFIRIETPDPMIVPMFFGDTTSAMKRDMFNSYSYGLLYGVVTALMLYNFILFIQLRLKRYLFYVVYLLMFLLMNQAYTGHAFYLYWSQSVVMQQWMIPILITLYSLSGIAFAFLFLNIQKYFPRIFKITIAACIVLVLLQLCLLILGLQSLMVFMSIFFVLCFSIFTLHMAILSLRYIPQEVGYFLIASIATLIGSVVTSMTVIDVIPYSQWSFRAVEIGLSIDVILLSIALAEQFRVLQKGKISAEKLARLDPLSGLYNRRAFYEMAQSICHNAMRYDHPISVIIFDIDHFKNINDQYGHNIGDEVIKLVSEVVHTIVRKSDVTVRWGGEEFVILLPETSIERAKAMAERLRLSIEYIGFDNFQIAFSFTISLGVAQMAEQSNSIEQLLKLADTRMYQAKEKGRNQVC